MSKQNETLNPMITVKPWADGPFELTQTPESKEMKSDNIDPFIRSASIMAVYHNMIIRGLNSIYLQAPHVALVDYKDFISYCDCWYQSIDSHHRSEEESMFPKIEEAVGEKGLLDVNVEQHNLFAPGIATFHAYLTSLLGRESSFSGSHLQFLIDDFAPSLIRHLNDEITTLLALRKYSSSLPILQITAAEGESSHKKLTKTGPVMFFFMNLDLTFEDGRWMDWPPIPRPVRWGLTRVFGWWNASWWKFASCDFDGKPQDLYALGGEH